MKIVVIGGSGRVGSHVVRRLVAQGHARYFGTELKGGELTPGDGARIGATDFDSWFAAQLQGVGR